MTERFQKEPVPRHVLPAYGAASEPEADLQNALTLHRHGQLDKAEQMYRKVLKAASDHFRALHLLGVLKHQRGQNAEALELISAALQINPVGVAALVNYGVILFELQRDDEALASYDKAITLKPDYAEAFNNRGNALKRLQRVNEALASYEKAIALKPDYAEAFNNRGNVLFELERDDEALASYDRAIALKPDYAEAFNNRGNVLRRLQHVDEALASYDKAIALKLDYAAAFNNRAIELTAVGRLVEARLAAEQAIKLAPRIVKYRCDLGEITRFGAGDPHVAAMEQLARDSALLSVGDRIELHFALGKAYEDQGRHAEAFRQWLDGNALKRSQIAYDEATALGEMDHALELFTPELIRSRHDVGEPSPVPIFIVGMPRSGTTLVEQILASHPRVFGGGELKHFEEAVKGIRTRLGSSAIFPELTSGMTDGDFRDLGARHLAEIERLAPAAMRITDKMPRNFIFAGLIHLALPNATIIHTIRDPIDTCISCFSKLFGDVNYAYDLAELGRYYRHYQALMAHWHRVLPPGRVLDVRYEDIVADLEGQARRIITHCGLDWDPRCLAFHQTERPVRTASATQVRQPIYNSAVGRWRVHAQFLGPLLTELASNEPKERNTSE